MTYTAREVQDALEAHTWDEDYVHYDYHYDAEGRYVTKKDENGDNVILDQGTYTDEFSWSEAEDSVGHVYDVLGGVEVIQSDPGGEGHGENIHVVVRVNETGQLFRIDGCYSSYGDGSVYDDYLRSVNAYERTVIVYE